MIKILAIGDPHFKVDNTEESEHFHLQVERWLSEPQNRVDVIVILGDILHSHEKIYTFAMNTAVKFIKMCSGFAPVYCLVGNHDATSNTIYCGQNHWMHVLHDQLNIKIVDKPCWIELAIDGEIQETSFLCCPYVSDGRFIEMLEEFVDGWELAKCIFAHQLLDGGKMGAIVASNVEKWQLEYPQIVSGHLHDRQQPQSNLYYAGSSQQLAFSENGDKSLALIIFDDEGDNKLQINEIFLQLKQRKTITVSCKDATSFKLSPNIQYKIVVRDDDAAIKAFKKTAKYKELTSHPQIRSVQFKRLEADKEDESISSPQIANDFLTLLSAKLQNENVYLQSYANSLLSGSEDLSDKDVMLIN